MKQVVPWDENPNFVDIDGAELEQVMATLATHAAFDSLASLSDE